MTGQDLALQMILKSTANPGVRLLAGLIEHVTALRDLRARIFAFGGIAPEQTQRRCSSRSCNSSVVTDLTAFGRKVNPATHSISRKLLDTIPEFGTDERAQAPAPRTQSAIGTTPRSAGAR